MATPLTSSFDIRWLLAGLIALIGSLGIFNEFPQISFFITFAIVALSIKKSKNFAPVLIILIFNSLFFLYSIPVIFFGFNLINYTSEEASYLLTQYFWIVALFLSSFLLGCGNNKNNRSYLDIAKSLKIPDSDIIFYIFATILFFVTWQFITGSIVIGNNSSYSEYLDNLDSISGIPEYALLILFLSGAMATSSTRRCIWYALGLFFVIKTSLLGLRIVSLMGGLTMIWLSGFNPRGRYVFGLFIIGFLAFSALGLLKGGSGIGDDPMALLFETHGNNAVSHHINVNWASASMLDLINQGLIIFDQRLDLVVYYSFNTLVPSSLVKSAMGGGYLADWLQSNGYTSGGGHIAVYAFVAAGPFFVALLGWMFGAGLKNSQSSADTISAQFFRCWFLVILITFPRWISYDLGNFFFRLPIYGAVIYIFLRGGSSWRAAPLRNPSP